MTVFLLSRTYLTDKTCLNKNKTSCAQDIPLGTLDHRLGDEEAAYLSLQQSNDVAKRTHIQFTFLQTVFFIFRQASLLCNGCRAEGGLTQIATIDW